MNPLQRFLSELRRRKVFRVAGVYAVAAWLIVQVADTFFPALRLPDWTVTLVAALAVLGFPVAVVLAWAVEITPHGLRRAEPGPTRPDGVSRHRSAYAAVAIAMAAGLGAYAMVLPARREANEIQAIDRSIAVLPFANVSGIEENEYFSDGMTEDILTRLAGLEDLRVISRTSIMTYKGSDQTVPEIAAELGVRYVLEGSVRRVDDEVRITGQLIDARTDRHLWAESYDRRVTDLLALQGEIATEIARALTLELSPGDRDRLEHRATASASAYDLYLKGRELLRADAAGPAERLNAIASAIAAFRAALAEDPELAAAYAGLAEAYFLNRSGPEKGQNAQERYDSTLAFARRAIDLDPQLADAYVQLANAHYFIKDYNEPAYDLFRVALRLNPNHVRALLGLGITNEQADREVEALENTRRAAMLDPNAHEAWRHLAMRLFHLGFFEQAEPAFRRGIPDPLRLECQLGHSAYYAGDTAAARQHLHALLAAPRSGFLLECIAVLQTRLGEHAAAEEHLRRFADELPPDERATLDLRFAYLAFRNGRPGEAQRLLERAEAQARAQRAMTPESEGLIWWHAHILTLQGELDRAVELLELAYSRGRSTRSYIETRSDIYLEKLRGHPGFEAFLARMKADHEAIRAEVQRRGLHE